MTTLNAAFSTMLKLAGNSVLTKANAVIGATATAFTTGNAITYAQGGILRTLNALTNQVLTALATADFSPALAAGQEYRQPSGSVGFYVQPAGTTVYYVLAVNNGVVRVVQGTYDGQPIQGFGVPAVGKSVIPDIPDQWVPFAVLKVVSGGSAFTPGSTALTGIGTFIDICVLPDTLTF